MHNRKYDGESRRFYLQRNEDFSGVSGTGKVCWGVLFPDGSAVTRWNSDVAQTCVWSSLEDVLEIHGHNGRTVLVWVDQD